MEITWTHMAEFDCYVAITDRGDLIGADSGGEYDITAPTPEFIEAVNEEFGTNYNYDDFPGR